MYKTHKNIPMSIIVLIAFLLSGFVQNPCMCAIQGKLCPANHTNSDTLVMDEAETLPPCCQKLKQSKSCCKQSESNTQNSTKQPAPCSCCTKVKVQPCPIVKSLDLNLQQIQLLYYIDDPSEFSQYSQMLQKRVLEGLPDFIHFQARVHALICRWLF